MTTKSPSKYVSQTLRSLKLFNLNRPFYSWWEVIKETYHPNAYLQRIRNVKSGLKARTRVLNSLEVQSSNAGAIAKENALSYAVVMHHLRLLEAEGVVSRKGSRPYSWVLTGLGQKRLVS